MSTKAPSVFKYTAVFGDLPVNHDKFVVVPAEKASNNIVFVKKHYLDYQIKSLVSTTRLITRHKHLLHFLKKRSLLTPGMFCPHLVLTPKKTSWILLLYSKYPNYTSVHIKKDI